MSVADIMQLSPMPPFSFLDAGDRLVNHGRRISGTGGKRGNRKNNKKKVFPIIHFSVCAFKQLRKAQCLLPQYSDSSYPHPDAYGCNHSDRPPVPNTICLGKRR